MLKEKTKYFQKYIPVLQFDRLLVLDLHFDRNYEIVFSKKMTNAAICHISVALNINFNKKRGFKDTENCQKCKF